MLLVIFKQYQSSLLEVFQYFSDNQFIGSVKQEEEKFNLELKEVDIQKVQYISQLEILIVLCFMDIFGNNSQAFE